MSELLTHQTPSDASKVQTTTLNVSKHNRMKKLLLILSVFLLTQTSFGQEGEVGSNTYTYQGPCSDSNGKPINLADFSNQVYTVKKFSKKTLIDFNIKSVKIGLETIGLDLKHKDKIEGETSIIQLTDTIGVKLVIGKTIENNVKKYVYKLLVFKKDSQSNCWRPLTTMNTMFDVYNQTLSLNLYSIGTPDTKDYFQIVEGWIKFN